MCFSAEASFGAAIALLPAGAYCAQAAWRKNRAYLPLALLPALFGLQQLCEARVWVGIERNDAEIARVAAVAYLFFALLVWPVFVPLAVAAVEPPGWKRWAVVALSGVGLMFALVYYVPAIRDGGYALNPSVYGHSVRYDLSAVESVHTRWWWTWPVLYIATIGGPMLASRVPPLRLLGAAVVLSAAVAFLLYEFAFASVWCFFAAFLSLHLAYVLFRLPDPAAGIAEPHYRTAPSN